MEDGALNVTINGVLYNCTPTNKKPTGTTVCCFPQQPNSLFSNFGMQGPLNCGNQIMSRAINAAANIDPMATNAVLGDLMNCVLNQPSSGYNPFGTMNPGGYCSGGNILIDMMKNMPTFTIPGTIAAEAGIDAGVTIPGLITAGVGATAKVVIKDGQLIVNGEVKGEIESKITSSDGKTITIKVKGGLSFTFATSEISDGKTVISEKAKEIINSTETEKTQSQTNADENYKKAHKELNKKTKELADARVILTKAEAVSKKDKTKSDAEFIADELFNSLEGTGTNENKFDRQIAKINKSNVVEVFDAYNAKHSDGLSEDADGDFDGGDLVNKYYNPIKNALVERANELGLTDEANELQETIDDEIRSGFWRNDETIKKSITTIIARINKQEKEANEKLGLEDNNLPSVEDANAAVETLEKQVKKAQSNEIDAFIGASDKAKEEVAKEDNENEGISDISYLSAKSNKLGEHYSKLNVEYEKCEDDSPNKKILEEKKNKALAEWRKAYAECKK